MNIQNKLPSTLMLLVSLIFSGYSNAEENETEIIGASDSLQSRDETGLDTSLLARVITKNGNTVEFHEVAPGDILIGEGGTYPQTPSLGRYVSETKNSLDLYYQIAPAGSKPPKPLLEASTRERELADLMRLAPTQVNSHTNHSNASSLSSSVVVQAALDTSKCPWSWFDNQFNHHQATWGWPSSDPRFTWEWPTRTGTSSNSKNHSSVFVAGTCVYRGRVRYNMSYFAGPARPIIPAKWLNAGQWWWWAKRAGFWAIDFTSRVDSANGDGYHHKGVGCKRKVFASCKVKTPDGVL